MDKLRIGAWCVDSALGEMTRDGETVRLEPRTLRLLLCLAERAGEIVSADELLSRVWPGVIVTPDSVYQAIASLRKVLGDDPKQPAYVVTVPRQGYRMVAEVAPWSEPATVPAAAPQAVPRPGASRSRLAALTAACAAICIGIFLWLHSAQASDHRTAIAVLPFADLTEGMKNETFADGMTEELIGRFSKLPAFKVPGPSDTFYYKNRQVPVAEIARKLGVVYILDGSVRASGGTVRVAARLVRADNGYIIWSESYDRPAGDLLMVQDDIATAVTKALKATIDRS